MIKTYSEYITELNKNTYLSAAKLAKEKNQLTRMRSFYGKVFGDNSDGFLLRGCSEPSYFTNIDINEKSWIKDLFYSIAINIEFVSESGTTTIITVNMLHNDVSHSGIITKHDSMDITSNRVGHNSVFVDRRSVTYFTKLLKNTCIDMIRDFVHDKDADVNIVESIREKINNIKPYDLWSDK